MATTRSSTLRTSTHAFCQALLNFPGPASILAEYFTSSPKITEHGPDWARSRLPFLSKTFSGKDGCEEYFMILGGILKMQLNAESFPPASQFIVDAEAGSVAVVGKGYFESVKTGKGWDETFIHRFSEFDEEGRIGHWEIWADPLSAYDAVGE